MEEEDVDEDGGEGEEMCGDDEDDEEKPTPKKGTGASKTVKGKGDKPAVRVQCVGYGPVPTPLKEQMVPPVFFDTTSGDAQRRRLAETAQSSYVQRYKTLGSWDAKKSLLQSACDAENELRGKFATDRGSPALENPYVNLLPVHQNMDVFKFAQQYPEEAAVPKVMPLAKRQPVGTPCVVSADEFRNNLDIFTESQFKKLNWDHIFMAGGSVLAALMPIPPPYNESDQTRRKYYHEVSYRSSDVDLFIYGLDEEAANKKLMEVYFAICEAIPFKPAIAFRSEHAVTIVSEFPYRHIQIILRLYKSPAEILMGFDVDSCSVGYDGTNVWMTPRCHCALVSQCNTIDISRRSPSYEVRLSKYSMRGFEVAVPNLDRNRIDPQVFERRFDKIRGLAKLLLLEKLATPEARVQFKAQQRLERGRPQFEKHGSFMQQVVAVFQADPYLKERMDYDEIEISDYSCVFLPWGPKWNAEKVRRLMYTKDLVLNSQWLDIGLKRHRHPCFFGTIEEILHDCCGKCPVVKKASEDEDHQYVSGALKWMTVNPGQQSIGSFHPITEGDWSAGAYVNDKTEALVVAVNSRNQEEIDAILASGADPNAKDGTGRTALHVAAFMNNVQAARSLLAKGARLDVRTLDGRTVFHICSAYGHIQMLELLLEHGKLVNQKLDQYLAELDAKAAQKRAEAGEDDEEEERDSEWYRKQRILQRQREREEAKKNEQLEFQQEFLDKMDLEKDDFDLHMTPLMYSVFFGKDDCVKLLVANGASVTRDLTGASSNSRIDEATITCYVSLLHMAIQNNHAQVVRTLLELGANTTTPPQNSPLFAHCQGETSLHKCVRFNRPECASVLLEFAKANPTKLFVDQLNMQAQSALSLAVQSRGAQFVQLLLDGGCSTTVDLRVQRERTGMNFQPRQLADLLSQAVNRAEPALVKVLLEAKCDPNVTTTQQTVLDTCKQMLANLKMSQHVAKVANVPPHTTALEYVDFLLAKTPEISFKRFVLETIRKKTEEENKANSASGAFGVRASNPATNSAARAEQEAATAAKIAKYVEIIALLKGNNAMTWRRLCENNQGAVRSTGPKRVTKSRAYAQNPYNNQFGRHNNQAAHNAAFILGLQTLTGPFVEKFQKLDGTIIEPEMQERYLQLYDAIILSDADKIRALTTGAPIDEEVHVCCRSTSIPYLQSLTPVDLAVTLNKPGLVSLLIQIASAQYTPPPPPEVEDQPGQVTDPRLFNMQVSNLDLLSGGAFGAQQQGFGFGQPSPFGFGQPSPFGGFGAQPGFGQTAVPAGAGMSSFGFGGVQPKMFPTADSSEVQNILMSVQQNALRKVGPAAIAAQVAIASEPSKKKPAAPVAPVVLRCTIPVHQLLRAPSGPQNLPGPLAHASSKGYTDVVLAICDACRELKLTYPVAGGFNAAASYGGMQSKAGTTAPPQELPLLPSLLRQGETPFTLALNNDFPDTARALLQQGATDCLQVADEYLMATLAEDAGVPYGGLSVSGSRVVSQRVLLQRNFLRMQQLTALHTATANGAVKSIRWLLSGDTDEFILISSDGEDEDVQSPSLFTIGSRNHQGLTAFHMACARPMQPQALAVLLEIGRSKNVKQMLALLNRNRFINAKDEEVGRDPVLVHAVRLTPLPAVRDENVDESSAALRPKSLECIRMLLAAGVNVNATNKAGISALHMASSNLDSELMTILLEAGANVGLPRLDGYTSLHCAVSSNLCGWNLTPEQSQAQQGLLSAASGLASLRLLLDKCDAAVVNAVTAKTNETALMFAVKASAQPVVQLLLQRGANPLLRDSSGMHTLHVAARANSLPCLRELIGTWLDAPASSRVPNPEWNAEDFTGHTPLDWCMVTVARALSTSSQVMVDESAPTTCLPALTDVHHSIARAIVRSSDVRAKTERAAEDVQKINQKTFAPPANPFMHQQQFGRFGRRSRHRGRRGHTHEFDWLN
eukprot:gnl/Spiro4/6750_TR3486_c0_g1_i1.p1 gnl/Spiro4/6750_TR3486_c0_g1~~gnl/Spiro4/6750_TR3486_c0_g1_i1.p1  ORF type:complete len:1979 (+),score=693.93 gnl/Spiro4/6750_TR3486_c0_g1_i1:115-5937(+)